MEAKVNVLAKPHPYILAPVRIFLLVINTRATKFSDIIMKFKSVAVNCVCFTARDQIKAIKTLHLVLANSKKDLSSQSASVATKK